MSNLPETTHNNLRVTISFKGPVKESDKGDIAGELIDAVEDALDEFAENPVHSITIEDDHSGS